MNVFPPSGQPLTFNKQQIIWTIFLVVLAVAIGTYAQVEDTAKQKAEAGLRKENAARYETIIAEINKGREQDRSAAAVQKTDLEQKITAMSQSLGQKVDAIPRLSSRSQTVTPRLNGSILSEQNALSNNKLTDTVPVEPWARFVSASIATSPVQGVRIDPSQYWFSLVLLDAGKHIVETRKMYNTSDGNKSVVVGSDVRFVALGNDTDGGNVVGVRLTFTGSVVAK